MSNYVSHRIHAIPIYLCSKFNNYDHPVSAYIYGIAMLMLIWLWYAVELTTPKHNTTEQILIQLKITQIV